MRAAHPAPAPSTRLTRCLRGTDQVPSQLADPCVHVQEAEPRARARRPQASQVRARRTCLSRTRTSEGAARAGWLCGPAVQHLAKLQPGKTQARECHCAPRRALPDPAAKSGILCRLACIAPGGTACELARACGGAGGGVCASPTRPKFTSRTMAKHL